ncbi:MAG TPA: MFS transporter, partial [Spirochaetes bacterium]|nr:MFS transporter [Spirochaetota bacterium]
MSKLPLSRKIAYGSGGLALNFINMLISQWLLRLYVPDLDGALVAPALFSAIFIIGRVVDGVLDPLVGYISDHTRSRWGRRIPFIAIFLIPTAVVTTLMWMPPVPGERSLWNAAALFALVQGYFIFWTLLANPYMSLIPQLSPDPKDRVDITTIQALFIMAGTLLSAVIGNIKNAFGWTGLGLVAGCVTVAAFLPTLALIREKPTTGLPREENYLRPGAVMSWLAETVKNRPFRHLLAATSLYWFSLNLVIILIPYWVERIAGRGDAEVVLVMVPFLLSNIVFFFIFNGVSKRTGKKPVFLFTLGGSACAILLLLLAGVAPVENMLYTQISMAVFGIPAAGFMMLPYALLADVVDHDETMTGKRREAIYYGVQAIFQKVSIGVSIAVASSLMFVGGDGAIHRNGTEAHRRRGGAVGAGGLCFVSGIRFE